MTAPQTAAPYSRARNLLLPARFYLFAPIFLPKASCQSLQPSRNVVFQPWTSCPQELPSERGLVPHTTEGGPVRRSAFDEGERTLDSGFPSTPVNLLSTPETHDPPANIALSTCQSLFRHFRARCIFGAHSITPSLHSCHRYTTKLVPARLRHDWISSSSNSCSASCAMARLFPPLRGVRPFTFRPPIPCVLSRSFAASGSLCSDACPQLQFFTFYVLRITFHCLITHHASRITFSHCNLVTFTPATFHAALFSSSVLICVHQWFPSCVSRSWFGPGHHYGKLRQITLDYAFSPSLRHSITPLGSRFTFYSVHVSDSRFRLILLAASCNF
jgi:hypothetical protein